MTERPAAGPLSAASRRPTALGRYRLLKKIGMGGMAEIWVASVAGISGVRKICVVKRILPHLVDSPEFVRMFLDEARIAATLDHPNLVQMYDIEEVDGVPVIAMEYLHGEDLRTIKKSLRSANRRMPVEHAITIAASVAAGLHYAHEKVGFDGKPLDIVHRDVSPHNVFVTYDGAVKILDFGIAKAANRVNETRDGALKGKVPYMSPEQCTSERLDRRSDIYSVGILLYEMSTGSRLFRRGATEFELMRAIVEDPVMPPSQVCDDYPPELERIVLKCLERDREKRYATARDLQIDLEAFAREERLATSSLALSSFMAELFGQRVEAWRGALASEAELLSHIVQKQESTQGDDSSAGDLDVVGGAPHGALSVERPGGVATKLSAPLFSSASRIEAAHDPDPPPPRSRRHPSLVDAGPGAELEEAHGHGPRALTVTKRRLGGLLIVSMSGRMTEELHGLAVARGIAGRVLFDLGGVQRVTSFGVREWMAMLAEVSRSAPEIYVGRCTEPIVNQVSMIRRFFGDGRIVSFYGPYRCERCGATFERLFDCDRDAHLVRTHEPPASPCPRCGGAAVFDDDAESYFAFAAAHAGIQLPEDVRAALDELARLDAGTHEAIEKTVDERGTRIRVRGRLDAHVRWKRALDGIEGDLVLDLTAAAGVTPEGAQALTLSLRALGDEVTSIQIEGCPVALLEHLAAASPPLGAAVVSALVDGACARCSAPRQTLLDVREAAQAALEDREPYMPCKRCNAPLSFAALLPVLKRLGAALEPARAPSGAPGPAATRRSAGMAPAAAGALGAGAWAAGASAAGGSAAGGSAAGASAAGGSAAGASAAGGSAAGGLASGAAGALAPGALAAVASGAPAGAPASGAAGAQAATAPASAPPAQKPASGAPASRGPASGASGVPSSEAATARRRARAAAAAGGPGSRWAFAAVGAAAALLVLSVGYAYLGWGRPRLAAGPAAGPGAAPAASARWRPAPPADEMPAWMQQPFAAEGDAIFVVGEGAGETREAALSVARADAISRLASNVVPALAGSQAHAFLEARGGGARRPGMAEAEASRYLKQVGAFATPERVDARFQERDGAVMAVARYRMRKESFDAAVQSYRRTESAFGMTAAPVFPLLEGELKTSGDAVVVAVDERSPAQAAGVRVGDVVVAVNGRPLANFDALRYSLSSLPEGAAVELTVESGGARRTLAIKSASGARKGG
ncbi:protein kinase domain-containing protein [Sorangium sp. So ce542]|uniref:protein kinase domain-containing protein n=1 Tax=Sorangium sp. So ce542 TaxID=3133316 RepID=UPI003F605C9D